MQSPISRTEFIALIAMLVATVAFSIDAMLPALPDIGAELSPGNVNRAQLVLTSFVFGMGIGTFFTGPLSDAFGRKPVILTAAALYIAASVAAWAGESLELVLAARMLQGLGAAGPRIVGIAMVRDFYAGREMARMLSVVMIIFTIFPALAPMIGAAIIAVSGWRAIFLCFVLFALVSSVWLFLRLPEPLPRDRRRPLRLTLLWRAVVEMTTHPTVRLSILVQCMCMGILFTVLSLIQPIYDQVFHRAASFPYWLAVIAVVSASASLLNAALVVRVGMRRMVTWSLAAQIVLSAAMLMLDRIGLPDAAGFAVFVFWQTSLFFMAGTTLGNLNAIAMEPMGHIAGMAASVIGAISTVVAALIAAPVGQLFDGSLTPLALGVLAMASAGYVTMLHMGRIESRLPV